MSAHKTHPLCRDHTDFDVIGQLAVVEAMA